MNKPSTATEQGNAPVKLPRGKLCDVRASLGVRLIQQGKDSFAVVYGRQVKERLNYAEEYAEKQEDRYMGSVFVNAHGQRLAEQKTREAYEACKRLGMTWEHGL